jgi:hypothetical protein
MSVCFKFFLTPPDILHQNANKNQISVKNNVISHQNPEKFVLLVKNNTTPL